MSRTGLSPADIAESFRDRCGDGSVEWVYTPTQTWVLLDAADMLDENNQLVMKLNAEHLVRQNVERENAKLRELVEDMLDCIEIREAFDRPPTSEMCEEFARRADELGVEVDG